VIQFQIFCENNKIKTHVLDATHAFHSRAMDPMLQKYKAVADTVTFNTPTIKFISGVEGKALDKLDADYWVLYFS
jgi:acyl transferase domain-containing protein